MTELKIEVVYALPDAAHRVALSLPLGATALQAAQASGLCQRFALAEPLRLAIFGKLAKPDAALHDGDRVEILRPLIADPKDVRRQRAAAGKGMKKG